MAPLTAEAFARLPLAAPYELERGRLRRLPPAPPGHRPRVARLARLLLPVVVQAGGWLSTHLVVAFTREPDSAARPDVAVGLAEPPGGGVCDVAPLLVVLIEGPQVSPERWLRAGAAAVWVIGRRGAVAHVPRESARVLDRRGVLSVPRHPRLDLPVASACGLVAPAAPDPSAPVAGAR